MTLARAICVARGNDVARGHKEQRNRREFRLCILCAKGEQLQSKTFSILIKMPVNVSSRSLAQHLQTTQSFVTYYCTHGKQQLSVVALDKH
jgi:hypothetical protein